MAAAPPPDQTQQALLLVQAQDAARTAAVAQAVTLAAVAARSFHGWYDTGEITDWAAGLARKVEAAQRSLARSTDAYLARTASLLTGRRVRPVGAVDVSALRAGVTHAGAYGRVADTYRYQVWLRQQPGASTSLEDPLDAALRRASAVAEMDMQLAVQRQSRAFMGAQRTVTGYRRVIHPELSKGGVCGLCVAASDRLYGPKELMPVHSACKCLPLAVYDGADPGSALNEGDLGRLYEDAGDTSRERLKRTRYTVSEHGELGPLLTPKGARFRGPRTVKRDERSH